MFVESAFITREFKEGQIPILEKVTSLAVVNTGNVIVSVNGVTIYPTQKQILIVADGTFSRVQLQVVYSQDNVGVKRKQILLIYKKLL